MSLDTDVLIIGAGMSGMGFAIQLIRHYNLRTFEIIEKVGDVGGTWLVNTYPGCGCDVASHFYSYSFALNPDWSQKFSTRSEIQAYFRGLAEKYDLIKHIRFQSTVEAARWIEEEQLWEVVAQDQRTKEIFIRRCRILISAVGSLSIPKQCEISGADSFKGHLFHSAQWDHGLNWKDKDIVVLGNGCSATQFVPVIAQTAGKLTQFARQAHFLAERPNPVYGPVFKAIMRHVPLAMRLYRFKLYADMEKDFAGFDIETGAKIRQGLKEENERYVKRMAPGRYWDALIPKHEIGCKRKVMDTDYLSCLHQSNVELVSDDPVVQILQDGVKTQSGRFLKADAIILATGFEVFRMLFPMEIIGEGGISLNEYWGIHHNGAAQAYLGTSIPGFKNFAAMMGPNTVTGHLSVIYTVECQINYVLRLIEPILNTSHQSRSLLPSSKITSVDVKGSSAIRDSNWMQSELKKLVWASGCTSWALDPKTGFNIAMYPEWQFLFWWRSIFIPSRDFEYEIQDKRGLRKTHLSIGGYRTLTRVTSAVSVMALLGGSYISVAGTGGLWHAWRCLQSASKELLKKLARGFKV